MSSTPLFPQYPGGQNKNIYNGIIPIGGIILWSGAPITIPPNWHICDGTNGTIDLSGKFILAAGNTTSVGASGGEATVTLDITEIPAHSHTITDNGHSHDINIPNGIDSNVPGGGSQSVSKPLATAGETAVATTGITINQTGGGGSHNNMPPYYALAYIMRVS